MTSASTLAMLECPRIAAPHISPNAARSLTVKSATDRCREEVLTFLAARPVHTVVMSGLIRDNGIVSPLNRGTFLLCRDAAGDLTGVALVGHVTLVEAHTDAALAALADYARLTAAGTPTRLMIGEEAVVGSFWQRFAQSETAPRRVCSELLFEQKFPIAVRDHVEGLRLAIAADLPRVASAHAQVAFAETGVNPLDVDPHGFRARTSRRIEQGRSWVLCADDSNGDCRDGGGRLIFKADIAAATPEVVYLEGIYVAPQERGNGWGVRCLSQLTRHLLAHAGSVCLLVNERNDAARKFYRRAGFKQTSRYHTVLV